METRDEPDLDRGRRRRSTPTRRAFLAAAGLLGAIGAVAVDDLAGAKRRGRKNQGRNKNQSNATSVGSGGAGGAGGNAGSTEVVCGPDFQNCQVTDEPE